MLISAPSASPAAYAGRLQSNRTIDISTPDCSSLVPTLAPVELGFLGSDSFALIQKKAGTTTLGLQIFLDTEIRLT